MSRSLDLADLRYFDEPILAQDGVIVKWQQLPEALREALCHVHPDDLLMRRSPLGVRALVNALRRGNE